MKLLLLAFTLPILASCVQPQRRSPDREMDGVSTIRQAGMTTLIYGDPDADQTIAGSPDGGTPNLKTARLNNVRVALAADVASINATIAAAPAGGVVVIPPGFNIQVQAGQQITIAQPVTLTLDGSRISAAASGVRLIVIASSDVHIHGRQGAKLDLGTAYTDTTAITLEGCSPVLGLRENITVSGLHIVGATQPDRGQVGVNLTDNNCAMDNLRIVNNTIEGVNKWGINVAAPTDNSALGSALIQGNHIKNVRWPAGGEATGGWGIVTGSYDEYGKSRPSSVRIVDNYIEDAARHAIYQANGMGTVIAGNRIKNHGKTDGSSLQREAIAVSRSSSIVVAHNSIDTVCRGSHITVSADNSPYTASNIVVEGNVFRQDTSQCDSSPAAPTPGPEIWVGALGPQGWQGQAPNRVTIRGNSVFRDGGDYPALRIDSGKGLVVEGNQFSLLSQTSGACPVFIVGTMDYSGTANYTDDLLFVGNYLYAASPNGCGVEFATYARTSAIRMRFISNTVSSTSPFYFDGGQQVNPNIVVHATDAKFGGYGLRPDLLSSLPTASPMTMRLDRYNRLSLGGIPGIVDGMMVYCVNCSPTQGTVGCTLDGSGAFAKRVAGTWRCGY